MGALLEVNDLRANVEETEILKGIDLRLDHGEVHAIMGPNGSGKSTMAYTLAGHPKYNVTDGEAYLEGENLLEMDPDERAKAGLFLAFQYPQEIAGVSLANFMHTALNAVKGEDAQDTNAKLASVGAFQKDLKEKMEHLKMDPAFMNRYLNEGFSGGEKKKNEMLQMAVLKPKLVVMDETDSGLDIDALQDVAETFNSLRSPERSALIITHYQRILDYIEPDVVHIMVDGRIVRSGDKGLAHQLEDKGYDWVREEVV